MRQLCFIRSSRDRDFFHCVVLSFFRVLFPSALSKVAHYHQVCIVVHAKGQEKVEGKQFPFKKVT